MRRLDCHEQLKQVLKRYRASLEISKMLTRVVMDHPQYLLETELTLEEIRTSVEGLQDIYFTRMFACFESSLRHYWKTKVRDTKPLTEQLISSIATRLGVPGDTLDTVQEVRDYRNHLIHGDYETGRQFTIEEAATYLNAYLARLPLRW